MKSMYDQECNMHNSSSQAATRALDQRKVIAIKGNYARYISAISGICM